MMNRCNLFMIPRLRFFLAAKIYIFYSTNVSNFCLFYIPTSNFFKFCINSMLHNPAKYNYHIRDKE